MPIELEHLDAVIFDLGGVLLDVDFTRSLQCWARLGARVPDVPPPHDDAYERFELGEITFTRYAEHLRVYHGLALDDAGLLTGWNAALGKPLSGAPELVTAAARRWPLHLFSNTNAAHHAHWRASTMALLAPFENVFTSHELGLRKPSRKSFREVVRRIGCRADRVLFLDDLELNVQGARAAGLNAETVRGPGDAARVLGLEQARGQRSRHR